MSTKRTLIGNIKGKPGDTPYITEDGNWGISGLDTGVKAQGMDGKSAYQYAVDGGYTGTEEEFAAKLNASAADAYTKTESDTKTAAALNEAKQYTDNEISELINGAPTTLDTLGEIATAMAENADVVEALNSAIGSKAAAADLTAHTGNKSNPHGVTAAQIGAAPAYTYGTADLTAGSSALETGKLYFVHE